MSKGEIQAMKRLAAAVLATAAEDYRNPRRAARETKQPSRETRNECAKFLVSNSHWHQILGLNPERAARWLRTQVEGTKRV